MMMDGWMMGGWWIVMLVWSLLILAGLALLIYGVVQLARGHSPVAAAPAEQGSSARRILDERYARGEIDEEEYRRRRDQLSS